MKRSILLLLLATFAAASDGSAALAGLDGLVLPVSAPRPGLPFFVELRLSTRLGVREGRAVVVLTDDTGEKARWEGPAWRIGTTSTSFRVLLPPARDWAGHDDLRAILTWQEDGIDYPLGRQVVARSGQTRLAVAELTVPGQEMVRALVMPATAEPTGDDAPARLQPTVFRLDPEQAPLSAEAWLAWDAVLLHPQASLPPAARTALTAWLLSGGRLVLAPGPSDPDVAALLAELHTAATADRSGPGWTSFDAGLGLVVVAEAGVDPPRVAGELWTRPAAKPTNHWRPDPSFQELLWPEQVGKVPLLLIFTVFAGFLLWVGPVEWFVLGRLRRRRWTWVTYPLAAIAATVAVTMIARGAFGSADHVRRLVVVDCDAAGVPRRTSIIEQRFAGGDRLLREQPAGELLMPLGSGRNPQRYGNDHEAIALRAVHRGPWHAGGEVEVLLPQWTPVLLRRLACRLPAELAGTSLGPAPGSVSAAQAGLDASLGGGWTFAAVLPGGSTAGSLEVFRSARGHSYRGESNHWPALQEALAGVPMGVYGDLAWGRPARLVARRQGDDIIIWRQALPSFGRKSRELR